MSAIYFLIFFLLLFPPLGHSQPTVTIGNSGPTINVGLGASSAKYASLSAAVTDFGSTVGTLIINTPSFSLGGNVTVPSTMLLEFVNGGTIACSTNTGTIQSSTTNWPSRQIFAADCSSTGSVDLSASVGHGKGLPQWFGGFPDDSTDDASAINALANAGGVGSKIFFSSGAWDVSTAILFQDYQVFECSAPGGEPLNTGTIIRTTSGGTKTLFAAKNAASGQTYHPKILNCGLQLTSNNHMGIDLSRVMDAEITGNKIRGNNTSSSGQVGILLDSNPSSSLGNKISLNTIMYTERGIVIRQASNANMIDQNKIFSNTSYGVVIQGTCSGGTCASTDSCESVSDCSGCSGTACSANVTGVSIGNKITNGWLEANGVNNILDFGKETFLGSNYEENTTGGTTGIQLNGFDTIVVGNVCQQTTSRRTFGISSVSGAQGVRIHILANTIKGAGTAIEELSAVAGSGNIIGPNTYESTTSKLVTSASTSLVMWDGTVPTDSPNTCAADRNGERYFDISLFEFCVCNSSHSSGARWCQTDGGGCTSSTSCG